MQIRYETMQVRLHGSRGVSSVATDPPGTPVAPCIKIRIRKGEDKGRKREKFYIYLDVTHTPGRSRVNPERQEEGKADTDDGQKARTARGGRERTDLQNQPTRRNGPDQNSAHT